MGKTKSDAQKKKKLEKKRQSDKARRVAAAIKRQAIPSFSEYEKEEENKYYVELIRRTVQHVLDTIAPFPILRRDEKEDFCCC